MKYRTAKKERRHRRHARVRAKVSGTAERPRLSVFKSNTNLYAQLIDDEKGRTLASASSKISGNGRGVKSVAKKSEQALLVGRLIVLRAKEKKISRVVFDRGGFIYQGKIKVFAEAARAGGLIF